MIHTITLNPAVDRTVTIDNFRIDSVNRILSDRRDPGGKGINVAKVIHSLGGRALAHGLGGGATGEWILERLEAMGISTCFTYVEGETRTNMKVVDPKKHTFTDINEAGPAVGPGPLAEFEARLSRELAQGDILVLSGSMPRGVPIRSYASWIEAARDRGVRTILDADGEALVEGLKGGPDLIKPNVHELERLAGTALTGSDAVLAAARQIMTAHGVGIVVVSLGADGAIFADPRQAWLAAGIKVVPRSTVGAGDAMVAAIALGLSQGKTIEDLVVPAVAAGTAAVVTEGSDLFGPDLVASFAEKVLYAPVS